MTPLSFDPVTAREYIGDAEARLCETKARTDADAGTYEPPKIDSTAAYMTQIRESMEWVVYCEQHRKRMERIARMKERA